MKLAYAIENIRRIRDFPEIELRPITVLVGRNSAGKSTFLRSLPLIRQSLETRSSAPILWYGDLVDFGDINVAVGENENERQAAFRFTISNVRGINRANLYYHDEYYQHRGVVQVECVSIRYLIGAIEDTTVLNSIEVKIPDEDIDILFNFRSHQGSDDEIIINGTHADFLPKTYNLIRMNRNLFSPPRFILKSMEKEGGANRLLRPAGVLAEVLVNAFSNQASKALSDRTLGREARRVLSENRFDSSTISKLQDTSSTVTFKKIYQHLLSNKKSKFKTQVFSIQRLARVFSVLEILEDQLTEYFLNVGYLEPVRAASERFYRKQELEVSEIAPNGANFPMFLASLAPRELDRFSKWVEEIFGYGVKVHETSGHISVQVLSDKRSVNVTDTGYGVSQILPVLGMIWWAQHRSPISRIPRQRRSSLRTLAIEQPELHLHPAHQAKLADVFVAANRIIVDGDTQPGIRLVIETHSEALIHRLGELVEEGKVSSSEIQIVIFSAQDDLSSPTEVSLARFDDTGALTDWPFGFFNYSD